MPTTKGSSEKSWDKHYLTIAQSGDDAVYWEGMETLNPTSLPEGFRRLLDLSDPWHVVDVEIDEQNEKALIRIAVTAKTRLPCPQCAKRCPRDGYAQERRWRHMDLFQYETYLACHLPLIRCAIHGKQQVNTPWSDPYCRFTHRFERHAIAVIRAAKSQKAAQTLLRLSWDRVHAIQERAVARGVARRKQENIRYAGLDEKSFRSGHRYATILSDLEKRCVVDVAKDRTKEAALSLLNTLSPTQRQCVHAVAADMWKPFADAIAQSLPAADLVHDKFHIASYLSKAVDAVRRREHTALQKDGINTLKGMKYHFLTNRRNMKKEMKRAFDALKLDTLKSGRAWSMKESFRHFWGYKRKSSAASFFTHWFFWATHSRLTPMIKVAKMLKRHLGGILAYFDHRITNAVSEGLNSKIQSIKSDARGFRNFEHYRIAIIFHCGKLDLFP